MGLFDFLKKKQEKEKIEQSTQPTMDSAKADAMIAKLLAKEPTEQKTPSEVMAEECLKNIKNEQQKIEEIIAYFEKYDQAKNTTDQASLNKDIANNLVERMAQGESFDNEATNLNQSINDRTSKKR